MAKRALPSIVTFILVVLVVYAAARIMVAAGDHVPPEIGPSPSPTATASV